MADPSRLGLHNQAPVTKHRMRSETRGGVTYYVGENGMAFRIVRTISQCLAGHVLLVNVVRATPGPGGALVFEETEEKRAIKRLVKYNLEHSISLDGRRISEDPVLEIGAMAYLSQQPHGNVLQLFNTYENETYVFLEMECLTGGDLFEAVQSSPGGRFPEARAKRVMRQLLQGLCFMHARGIIHRDLSLENTMLSTRGEDSEAKIIDLGLCVNRWLHAPGRLPPLGCVGKAAYMAPEVFLNAEFAEPADVWCVGVMLFMMLFGVPPYRKPHADLCALFREIQNGRLLDLLARWGMAGSASAEAQDLLRRMLTVDQDARPTLPEVLAHPWMAEEMAGLGGSARAAHEANYILDVGRRVNKLLHDARSPPPVPVAAPAPAPAPGGGWPGHGAAAVPAATPAGGAGAGASAAASSGAGGAFASAGSFASAQFGAQVQGGFGGGFSGGGDEGGSSSSSART